MDIVADSLTKVRNALLRKLKSTSVKKNKVVEKVLSIMKEEGYILDYKQSKKNPYEMEVILKYYNGKAVISGLKKVSKLSRRIYVGKDDVPSVLNNYGIAILSTSKGVMTGKEATSLKVGGEVICYIW